MKSDEKVLIVDFGGQYKELIARRVRECGVLSLIVPNTRTAEEIAAMEPIGLIFTGGPQSAYAADAPRCDPALFSLGVPVLGICDGMQLMCQRIRRHQGQAGEQRAVFRLRGRQRGADEPHRQGEPRAGGL